MSSTAYQGKRQNAGFLAFIHDFVSGLIVSSNGKQSHNRHEDITEHNKRYCQPMVWFRITRHQSKLTLQLVPVLVPRQMPSRADGKLVPDNCRWDIQQFVAGAGCPEAP